MYGHIRFYYDNSKDSFKIMFYQRHFYQNTV